VVYWFLVWDCIRPIGGNFGFCAVDMLRLGVSYSSVAAWAYVIMGREGVLVAPLVGMVYLLGNSHVWIRYLQVPYSIIVDPVSLCDACRTCERFGGSWISVH